MNILSPSAAASIYNKQMLLIQDDNNMSTIRTPMSKCQQSAPTHSAPCTAGLLNPCCCLF